MENENKISRGNELFRFIVTGIVCALIVPICDVSDEIEHLARAEITSQGVIIPHWDRIKQDVLDLQRQIPYAHLIGWDITMNQDNQVSVIEINLDGAEIEAHQVFNGPVFGDRFDEIRKYINEKKPMLRHAMITF